MARSRSTNSPAAMSRVAIAHRPRLRAPRTRQLRVAHSRAAARGARLGTAWMVHGRCALLRSNEGSVAAAAGLRFWRGRQRVASALRRAARAFCFFFFFAAPGAASAHDGSSLSDASPAASASSDCIATQGGGARAVDEAPLPRHGQQTPSFAPSASCLAAEKGAPPVWQPCLLLGVASGPGAGQTRGAMAP